MNHSNLILRSAALFFLILVQCGPANRYPKELDPLVQGATLVFRGKILLLHTVTTDEQDVADSGVVLVTEVMDAPAGFRNIIGSQVTVHFIDIRKATVGEERIFFTEPYWIGESLGSQERGSIAKSNKLYESREIASFIKLARNAQDDERLRAFIKTSKVIVTGKVTKTEVPAGYRRRATEHDPEWKEAEIEIDKVLKGTAGKTIRILFSSSKDNMFAQSPKLKSGDEGIFITQPTDSTMARPLRNPLMIIHANGFIPGKSRTNEVKSLID